MTFNFGVDLFIDRIHCARMGFLQHVCCLSTAHLWSFCCLSVAFPQHVCGRAGGRAFRDFLMNPADDFL